MSSMKSGHVHLCYPRGPDGVVRCYRHALPARRLTAQTALNPNRDFWRCSLDQPAQCSFFTWDDEIPGPRPSTQSQEHSQSRTSSLPPSSPPQQQNLPDPSHACSSSRSGVSSAHLGGSLHSPQSPQSSTPHRNAPMSSPPTPSRNTGGKPKLPGPDHRHAPVSRQRRLMALQSALGEIGPRTLCKPSSEPSTPARSTRATSPRLGPSQPKSSPEATASSAPHPTPSVEIKSAQADLLSPLPFPEVSPVLSPHVDSSVVADHVDSEEEYWATTTLRAPVTVAVANAFTEADLFPAPAAPRPYLTPQENDIVVITTDMEGEEEGRQHSSSSWTKIVTPTISSSTTPKPAAADKGKGRAIPPFSDSEDDFLFSSDESYCPPRKRPSVSTTFSLSDSDDNAPTSPLKRHRALGPLPTPPASSPVLRPPYSDDDDDDVDLPIPGAFDFESERSRSVSPSSEREAKEDSKRSDGGGSPMKGVRFVLSPGNRPIYPDLPSSSRASASPRTRSNSWSADVASADLIGELARRTSERAGGLSSDARKLRTLELYVRGLELKLVASEEQVRVKDAENRRLKEAIRNLEEGT